MKTVVTRRSHFRASHNSMPCSVRAHGHDWFISWTFSGEPNKDGYLDGSMTKLEVFGITSELDYEDLNVMVVGAFPTPEGIAAWALERLRPHIPGLRSVTVGFEGYEATVEV